MRAKLLATAQAVLGLRVLVHEPQYRRELTALFVSRGLEALGKHDGGLRALQESSCGGRYCGLVCRRNGRPRSGGHHTTSARSLRWRRKQAVRRWATG